MTTKDKVAMILTRYGYSLDEGMKLYDELWVRSSKLTATTTVWYGWNVETIRNL